MLTLRSSFFTLSGAHLLNIHCGLEKWAQAGTFSQRSDTWLSQKNLHLELKDVFRAINNIYRRLTGEESKLLFKSRFMC